MVTFAGRSSCARVYAASTAGQSFTNACTRPRSIQATGERGYMSVTNANARKMSARSCASRINARLKSSNCSTSLDQTLNGATKLITRVDTELVPGIKTDLEALQRTLGNVDRTLKHADTTLKNADTSLLHPDAPAQQELRDALNEFTRAARSLRVFLDYLERHPDSAIRGKLEDKGGAK